MTLQFIKSYSSPFCSRPFARCSREGKAQQGFLGSGAYWTSRIAEGALQASRLSRTAPASANHPATCRRPPEFARERNTAFTTFCPAASRRRLRITGVGVQHKVQSDTIFIHCNECCIAGRLRRAFRIQRRWDLRPAHDKSLGVGGLEQVLQPGIRGSIKRPQLSVHLTLDASRKQINASDNANFTVSPQRHIMP